MERFAVFTNNIIAHQNIIEHIKQYLQSKYSCDFFVFTDDMSSVSSQTIGVLPYFYMRFFQGTTIFLSANEYHEHRNKMLVEPLLYSDNDQHTSDNCNILTLI